MGAKVHLYGPGVDENELHARLYGKIPVHTELTVLPADRTVWCPLCEMSVHENTFGIHCRRVGDEDHLALEVMEE